MSFKIGVTGLWHLGCVLCASWAGLGHEVVGHDEDGERIAALRAGRPPLYEPGLAEALQTGRIRFTTHLHDMDDCDFVFLAMDTPVDEQDRSIVEPLEKTIAGLRLGEGAIVIVSAQSPVGLCRKLRERTLPNELAYSPENLRLGQALECYRRPGHIVLGTADAETERRCRELFAPMEAQIFAMSLESAEMLKHGINSFLAQSIVYANHLANACERTGADVLDVMRAMKADPRIGPGAYLSPGVGFSGGTLGRDLRVLGKADDYFDELWRDNASRIDQIVDKVRPSKGMTVGVLGLTYKPGTSTLRRSVPLAIAERLAATGAAVRAFDPKADYSELTGRPGFQICESAAQAAEGADLLVLLTAWPEFRGLDWPALAKRMKTPRLLDALNFLGDAVEGFVEVQGVGRAAAK